MHLTDDTIDAYLAGKLDGDALESVDDHTAGCLDCAIALENAALDEGRWRRGGLLSRLASAGRSVP